MDTSALRLGETWQGKASRALVACKLKDLVFKNNIKF